MTTQSRHEIIRTIRKFVEGEASLDDLYSCVERARFTEIDAFLEHLQLSRTDFDLLAPSEAQLGARLEQYLSGRLGFFDLADWALQLYRIFSSTEYRQSCRYSARVDRALMMLALVVDLDLTETLGHSRRLCQRLADVLRRRHALPCEAILRQLFRGKQSLRFATSTLEQRELGDSVGPEPGEWLDLALVSTTDTTLGSDREVDLASTLDLPFAAEVGESLRSVPDRRGWFIPIAVCTEKFFQETRPEGSWCNPENDKVYEIRELATSDPDRSASGEEWNELRGESYSRYYVDPDGLVEVVVDSPEIGRREAEIAVRLFCLRNGIARCYLDDAPVFPAKEEL